MRMWMVNPSLLCRKHLLGEHVELHMLVTSINKKRSIEGFIKLVETAAINARHEELAIEINMRGYKHRSELIYDDKLNFGSVDIDASLRELQNRCADCRDRIISFMIESARVNHDC